MAVNPTMANVFINKALRKDIPSDAIILTRSEALEMQWQTIRNWKSKRDTWPFTVGLGVLSSMNAATNLTIVQHFRDQLYLGNYGRITMALPTTFIPCVLSAGAHYLYVTNSILLGEECPLCVQTRAAALQVAFGVALPFITTPFAAFFYATTYRTYDIPALKMKNLPNLANLWLSLTTRLRKKLPLIIGLNAITAAALTYFEADSFYRIQSIIYQKEEQFKRQLTEFVSEQA